MADIRIKDLATTASSTASDDFVAIDGSANGTRKLSAYSPTFGGNVVATGTLTVNSTTDSSSKDTGAIITEGGLGVEKSATIGGNLTVSGTGTSSVAGSFGVGAASPVVGFSGNEAAWIVGANRTDGGGGLYPILLTLNDTRAYNATNPSPGGGLGFTYKYNTAGNYASGVTIQGFKENSTDGDYAGGLRFLTRANAAQPAEAMRITSSGNLLLKSDGVDSGNGKLQLAAGAADKTSGIGFSSDVSLYRSAAGRVTLDHVGGSAPFLFWAENGTTTAGILTSAGDMYIGTRQAGKPVYIQSGNATTALTLDSSQRANFAGGIKISGNHTDFNTSSTFILGRVAGEPILMFSISSAAADERFYDFTATPTQFAMRLVNDAYSAATNFITVDRTGTTVDSVAIGGPLKLNNAYQAGAPTATGYVTIQDSAGNTYKVLVGT